MADKDVGYRTSLPDPRNPDNTMLHLPNDPNLSVQSSIQPHLPSFSPDYVAQLDMDSSYHMLCREGKHRSVSSPINDVPDDILMEIFWWATYETRVDDRGMLTPPPSPTDHDHADSLDIHWARWVIPQVCRRWNAVSRTLAMWQHIYLTAATEYIVLSSNFERRSTREEIRRYIHRWQARLDLEYSARITDLLVPSNSELFLDSMPNLERLHLFNISHDSLPQLEGDHVQLPMLKTLLLIESEEVVYREVNDLLQVSWASPIESFMKSVSTPSVEQLLLDFGPPGDVSTMPALSEVLSGVKRLSINGHAPWTDPSDEESLIPLYSFLEKVPRVNVLELNVNVAQQVLEALKMGGLRDLRKIIIPVGAGISTELMDEIYRMRGEKLAIERQAV